MGSHNPFGHLKHKLGNVKTTKKSGIAPISLHAGGVQHTIEKLSTKATILFQTSSQLEVCT